MAQARRTAPARADEACDDGRRTRRAFCALLATLALATRATAGDPTVLLLSWDGVRYDYPDRGELPGLARMEREGARAERLVPVYPTNTFPNHVALATGTYTDRHGIVDNRFRDRERGTFDYGNDASWLDAEPLWVAAERQGVRAAVFFWVGSETDWRGVGASDRVAPFDGGVGEREKVDRILSWLDRPVGARPRLVMSWWHGADRVAHLKGPEHPDVFGALAEQDRELQRLLEALDARDAWGHTTLLLVSDHGMTAVDEVVDLAGPLEAAGIAADVIRGSAVAHVYLEDGATLEAARAVLAAVPGVTVYALDEVPRSFRIRHALRSGDLVVVTRPPRTFAAPEPGEAALRAVGGLVGDWERGMHGYAPDHPDMGAVFFALGRGVPAGTRLGTVRAIDVAPTAAGLLGIEPPLQAEGVPIEGIGAAPTPARASASSASGGEGASSASGGEGASSASGGEGASSAPGASHR